MTTEEVPTGASARVEWSPYVLGAVAAGVTLRLVLLAVGVSLPARDSTLLIALTPFCGLLWFAVGREYAAEWRENGLERFVLERAGAASFVVAAVLAFLYGAVRRVVELPSLDGIAVFLGMTLLFCAADIVVRHRMT